MEVESGENLNFRVPSRPVVDVAACVIFLASKRGSRNVDVQPAPRIRILTSLISYCSVNRDKASERYSYQTYHGLIEYLMAVHKLLRDWYGIVR